MTHHNRHSAHDPKCRVTSGILRIYPIPTGRLSPFFVPGGEVIPCVSRNFGLQTEIHQQIPRLLYRLRSESPDLRTLFFIRRFTLNCTVITKLLTVLTIIAVTAFAGLVCCSSGGGGDDGGSGGTTVSCAFGPVNPSGQPVGSIVNDPANCQCPAQATANGDGTYTCH
jgi:hypothetical protein